MGAWNYGLLDNDPAQDIKDLWEEIVGNGHSADEVTSRCFSRWGEAVEYGDTITNMEILALIALYLNSNVEIPPKLVGVGTSALNRELIPQQLELWEDPAKRKDVLLRLLERLGGEVKAPKKAFFFKDPAITYSSIEAARTALLKIVDDANNLPWITYLVKKQMAGTESPTIPPFMKTLDRYMKHRIWEKDQKIHDQAIIERLMMISVYLAIWLRMPRAEIEALLDRCKVFNDKL